LSPFCGVVNLDGAPVEPEVLRTMIRPLIGNGGAQADFLVDGPFGAAVLGTGGSFGGSSCPPRRITVVCDARNDDREGLEKQVFSAPAKAGRTDGDLLAAAYVRWGRGWHENLKGAFAAALWDSNERTLVLLRDRVGERGLYWSRTSRRIFFASEPILIAASGEVDRQPNRLRLLSYLVGSRPDPHWSFFEGVHRVPEGCQLLARNGREELDRYWTWSRIRTVALDQKAVAEELAARLCEAVCRRLPAQNETGIILSGGLDSSSVAALAADLLHQRQRELHAFTWTSSTADGIDETPLSRFFIASRLNVTEHPVEADALWPLSRFPQAYSDLTSPETNSYPDLLLATLENARASGVSMLMTGIGGDPVIGWQAPDLALLAQGHLRSLIDRWRAAGFHPRRIRLLRELRVTTGRIPLPAWLTPEGKKLARNACLDGPSVRSRTLCSPQRFRAAFLTDPSHTGTLERYSRLSHRHGLRIEAPWCDFDLASLVLSLPGCGFAEALPMKGLLRAAMAPHLPGRIVKAETEKQEHSNLRSQGLLTHAIVRVEALLTELRLQGLGLIDGAAILAEYRKARSSRLLTTVPRLWHVLTAETWFQAQQEFW
jgi:asparagine synthetase B (glutamine-hydrolysing)